MHAFGEDDVHTIADILRRMSYATLSQHPLYSLSNIRIAERCGKALLQTYINDALHPPPKDSGTDITMTYASTATFRTFTSSFHYDKAEGNTGEEEGKRREREREREERERAEREGADRER